MIRKEFKDLNATLASESFVREEYLRDTDFLLK
jgi:hypothetical protein